MPLTAHGLLAPTGRQPVETFRIRRGHGSANPFIEFCGDHRAPGYPDVPMLLAAALGATQQPHTFPTPAMMMATDWYVSTWAYPNGRYEIDDDVGSCVIRLPDDSPGVIADLERVLTASGRFRRVADPDAAA